MRSVRSPLPAVFGWVRGLVWPFWFRFVPMPLLRRMLPGYDILKELAGQTQSGAIMGT